MEKLSPRGMREPTSLLRAHRFQRAGHSREDGAAGVVHDADRALNSQTGNGASRLIGVFHEWGLNQRARAEFARERERMGNETLGSLNG